MHLLRNKHSEKASKIWITILLISLTLPSQSKARESELKDGLNFYRHHENYFISGKEETKIQLSFKMEFLSDWGLYLAYTQLMFWDIGRGTSHFSDVNYNPEFFYRWKTGDSSLKEIDFCILEHKSDGQHELNARSWNRTYINLRNEFGLLNQNLRTETKFYYFYQYDDMNSEIFRKLGFIEFGFTFENLLHGHFRQDELNIKIVPGGIFSLTQNEGHQEINLKIRLQIPRLNPYIYFQVFNGTDEKLIRYNETATSYRIGLAL